VKKGKRVIRGPVGKESRRVNLSGGKKEKGLCYPSDKGVWIGGLLVKGDLNGKDGAATYYRESEPTRSEKVTR